MHKLFAALSPWLNADNVDKIFELKSWQASCIACRFVTFYAINLARETPVRQLCLLIFTRCPFAGPKWGGHERTTMWGVFATPGNECF